MSCIATDRRAGQAGCVPQLHLIRSGSVRRLVFTDHRTPNTSHSDLMAYSAAARSGPDAEAAFIDAVNALGLTTAKPADASADLMVDVNGHWLNVELKRYSTVGSSDVERLLAQHHHRPDREAQRLRVLVADRIVGNGRDELKSRGWGWLDLRGHLFLSAPGLLIDAEVPAFRPRPHRTSPFSGSVGKEVACALLMEPDIAPTVRGLARTLSRAPSPEHRVRCAQRSSGRRLDPARWHPSDTGIALGDRRGMAEPDSAAGCVTDSSRLKVRGCPSDRAG